MSNTLCKHCQREQNLHDTVHNCEYWDTQGFAPFYFYKNVDLNHTTLTEGWFVNTKIIINNDRQCYMPKWRNTLVSQMLSNPNSMSSYNLMVSIVKLPFSVELNKTLYSILQLGGVEALENYVSSLERIQK